MVVSLKLQTRDVCDHLQTFPSPLKEYLFNTPDKWPEGLHHGFKRVSNGQAQIVSCRKRNENALIFKLVWKKKSQKVHIFLPDQKQLHFIFVVWFVPPQSGQTFKRA